MYLELLVGTSQNVSFSSFFFKTAIFSTIVKILGSSIEKIASRILYIEKVENNVLSEVHELFEECQIQKYTY